VTDAVLQPYYALLVFEIRDALKQRQLGLDLALKFGLIKLKEALADVGLCEF
jgi:hypothetical protein